MGRGEAPGVMRTRAGAAAVGRLSGDVEACRGAGRAVGTSESGRGRQGWAPSFENGDGRHRCGGMRMWVGQTAAEAGRTAGAAVSPGSKAQPVRKLLREPR